MSDPVPALPGGPAPAPRWMDSALCRVPRRLLKRGLLVTLRPVERVLLSSAARERIHATATFALIFAFAVTSVDFLITGGFEFGAPARAAQQPSAVHASLNAAIARNRGGGAPGALAAAAPTEARAPARRSFAAPESDAAQSQEDARAAPDSARASEDGAVLADRTGQPIALASRAETAGVRVIAVSQRFETPLVGGALSAPASAQLDEIRALRGGDSLTGDAQSPKPALTLGGTASATAKKQDVEPAA